MTKPSKYKFLTPPKTAAHPRDCFLYKKKTPHPGNMRTDAIKSSVHFFNALLHALMKAKDPGRKSARAPGEKLPSITSKIVLQYGSPQGGKRKKSCALVSFKLGPLSCGCKQENMRRQRAAGGQRKVKRL